MLCRGDCGLRWVMGVGPTSEEWPSSLFQVSRLNWSRLSVRLEVVGWSCGSRWLALCQQLWQLPQDCPKVSLTPHVLHIGTLGYLVDQVGTGPGEDDGGAADQSESWVGAGALVTL